MSGDFAFEKSVNGATTKILVGAANIDAFLGTADKSMGVQVTDANLGLVLFKTGTALQPTRWMHRLRRRWLVLTAFCR